MVFDHYTPEHAARLEAVLAEPDWQEALRDGTFDLAARTLRTPPAVTNVFALPVEQLKALNGARVQELIAAGERDEERLLSALGTWPSQWPADLPVRLSFVGLNLGFACDMVPRCLYCNQQPVREGVTLDQWKTLLRALPSEDGKGVYVYFTGGEPLVLGEGLWGEEGLIRAAGEANAASNVNTNGLSLTPRAALGLVSSGTGRLHLSMDTCRPEVADALYQREGCWRQVLRGLHNVQIAKALLRVAHPVIHLNCVLTRRNAAEFPEFVRFILSRKPLLPDALSPDLDFHLIPVGGEQNRALRLTAEGYERFFGETWAQAEDVWQKYLRERGVAAELQKTLTAQMPFLSPYHRVQQRGELCEWARRAAPIRTVPR
ncbi:MAG: radical SAM protein, partial [Armatimonadota bacterium]